jgi:hypothetical protein
MIPEFKPGDFPDPLQVEDANGERNFELTAPFRYQYAWESRPLRPFEIFVPSGTPWNGASIPRFFWRVFGSPFVGLHRKPSVVHDYLWIEAKAGRCTYQRANWVFWHALRSQGVRPFKAWLMWAATEFNAWLHGA